MKSEIDVEKEIKEIKLESFEYYQELDVVVGKVQQLQGYAQELQRKLALNREKLEHLENMNRPPAPVPAPSHGPNVPHEIPRIKPMAGT